MSHSSATTGMIQGQFAPVACRRRLYTACWAGRGGSFAAPADSRPAAWRRSV